MRRLLGLLFAVVPFVAGLIALLSARRDSRMIWMAVAATLVARLVARFGPGGEVAVGLGAFLAATVAAAVVAVSFGARGLFGVVAVAVVLAGCAAAGAVLGRRAR